MKLDLTALPTITRERDDQVAVIIAGCKNCHQTIEAQVIKDNINGKYAAWDALVAHVDNGHYVRVLYSSEPIALNGCECKEES